MNKIALLPLMLSVAAALSGVTALVAGPARTVLEIWPEGVPGLRADAAPEVPGDERVSQVHVPTLTVYPAPADLATGTAVVICPGGGYGWLSTVNEGSKVAAWLNSIGVTAFELHYRLSEYGQPAPLRDVLRALRFARSRAAGFGVRPDRIGVMGFSAGGHLASCAATLFDDPDGRTGAPLDAVSARPDFAVLLYPVISLRDPFAHAGSRQNLLGASPSPELIAHYSTDGHVTAATPPTFLVHAEDDGAVPVENTLMFYRALRAAHVPAEVHIYAKGGHGFGMRGTAGLASTWTERCADWLRAGGWLRR
jgi:acetyl esterase/lipase